MLGGWRKEKGTRPFWVSSRCPSADQYPNEDTHTSTAEEPTSVPKCARTRAHAHTHTHTHTHEPISTKEIPFTRQKRCRQARRPARYANSSTKHVCHTRPLEQSRALFPLLFVLRDLTDVSRAHEGQAVWSAEDGATWNKEQVSSTLSGPAWPSDVMAACPNWTEVSRLWRYGAERSRFDPLRLSSLFATVAVYNYGHCPVVTLSPYNEWSIDTNTAARVMSSHSDGGIQTLGIVSLSRVFAFRF